MGCPDRLSRHRFRASFLPVAALLVALPVGSAVADGPDLLENPFSVSLGTFILNTDTDIRLDASNIDTGTEFNWESAFGGGNVSRFRLDCTWRFKDRHRLRGMWFDYTRTRTGDTERQIEWGEEVFPVGLELTGEYKFSILELAYEYSFLKSEDLELSGTAGIHWTQFKASISGTLETPEGGGTREASRAAKLDVPLPVIGGHALWRMGGDFWLDANVQIFSLSYDVYDGRVIDARIGVLWQPKNWVGVGIGYNRFDVDIDVEKNSFRGSLEWIYDGPQIFYNVSF